MHSQFVARNSNTDYTCSSETWLVLDWTSRRNGPRPETRRRDLLDRDDTWDTHWDETPRPFGPRRQHPRHTPPRRDASTSQRPRPHPWDLLCTCFVQQFLRLTKQFLPLFCIVFVRFVFRIWLHI